MIKTFRVCGCNSMFYTTGGVCTAYIGNCRSKNINQIEKAQNKYVILKWAVNNVPCICKNKGEYRINANIIKTVKTVSNSILCKLVLMSRKGERKTLYRNHIFHEKNSKLKVGLGLIAFFTFSFKSQCPIGFQKLFAWKLRILSDWFTEPWNP